jgi:hypothetical protein
MIRSAPKQQLGGHTMVLTRKESATRRKFVKEIIGAAVAGAFVNLEPKTAQTQEQADS